MRPGKDPAPEPAVVSVKAILVELRDAHGWNPHEPIEEAAARVAGFCRQVGVEPADYWTPTLSAEQAREVLHRITNQRDPLDEAREREAFQADEYLRSPVLSASELMSIRGMPEFLATHPGAVKVDEAYGPADQIAPGSLREAIQRRRIALMEGESYGAMFVAVPGED